MIKLIYTSILTEEQLTQDNIKLINSGVYYSSIIRLEDGTNLVKTYEVVK